MVRGRRSTLASPYFGDVDDRVITPMRPSDSVSILVGGAFVVTFLMVCAVAYVVLRRRRAGRLLRAGPGRSAHGAHHYPGAMRRQAPFQAWLDGVDAVATTIYVVLIAIVVGGAFGVVLYLFQHWQPSWDTQGEGFYLVVAFLLVIGWAMGQLAWLSARRRGAWMSRSSPIDISVDHKDAQSADRESGDSNAQPDDSESGDGASSGESSDEDGD